jgi:hypothetical protein
MMNLTTSLIFVLARSAGWCGARRIGRMAAGGRFLMFAAAAFARPDEYDMNVVVDFTEAGRKVAAPTREQPAFYVPIIGGYHERGAVKAGERPPAADKVLEQLVLALEEQGYRIGKPDANPSLLLMLHWGTMNPELVTYLSFTPEGGTQENEVFFNEREMYALVAGNTGKHSMPPPDWFHDPDRDVKRTIREDRYFVVVGAFDWASVKQRKPVLLWSAKFSGYSQGIHLMEAIPALVKGGAPFFGRETKEPQRVPVPLLRDGKVELGETEMKEFISEPLPPAEAKR